MAKSSAAHQQKQDLIKVYRQALTEGVSLDKIEQKVEKLAERFSVAERQETAEVNKKNKNFRQAIPRALRIGAAVLPTVLLLLGLGLVGSATYPILAYYVGDFSDNMVELKAPIPPEELLDITPLVITSAQADSAKEFGTEVSYDNGPVILDSALDYTDLSNWFQGIDAPELEAGQEAVTYMLDIPKLDIQQAEVVVGGTDLDRSLIQYPGTALPGQPGAPVIFGHSVLRQFYNPSLSNPRRYNSIFSYIMTLERGDKIYVTQDNVRYTYVVQSKTEVKPADTYILSQRYDSRQLKLVTCTPEGTYLRRGVITAQLVKE
jgi:LPXTG-site transpeptidase (sortase) family protein